MKDNQKKLINYFYFFCLLVFLVFYLFPGNVVSYFINGELIYDLDMSKNPVGKSFHYIINTGGYSLNHILSFSFITLIGFLTYFKKKKIRSGLYFFILLSIILELLHMIVPNRSFELSDLLSNILGVFIAFGFFKIFQIK
jgi:glycopeptide antibiotics resistance protein